MFCVMINAFVIVKDLLWVLVAYFLNLSQKTELSALLKAFDSLPCFSFVATRDLIMSDYIMMNQGQCLIAPTVIALII